MYTHRKEIPNPMSNKNLVFDNSCDSFLNIHKLWRYPQASMVNDAAEEIWYSSSTHRCIYENNLNLFQVFYNLLRDALNALLFNARCHLC